MSDADTLQILRSLKTLLTNFFRIFIDNFVGLPVNFLPSKLIFQLTFVVILFTGRGTELFKQLFCLNGETYY